MPTGGLCVSEMQCKEGGDDAGRVGRKRGGGGESKQSLRHSAGREKKSRVTTAGDVGVNELIVFKLGIM